MDSRPHKPCRTAMNIHFIISVLNHRRLRGSVLVGPTVESSWYGIIPPSCMFWNSPCLYQISHWVKHSGTWDWTQEILTSPGSIMGIDLVSDATGAASSAGRSACWWWCCRTHLFTASIHMASSSVTLASHATCAPQSRQKRIEKDESQIFIVFREGLHHWGNDSYFVVRICHFQWNKDHKILWC